MNTRTVRAACATTLAAALLLSACHKKPPEPQNTVMELPPVQPQQPAPPPPQPTPKPKAEKPIALPADHAEPSEEEQMREDAEATGMTSRVANSSDTTAPASGGGNASQR